MSRSIELTLTEEFIDVNVDNGKNMNAAIGYLSRWAIHSDRYCKVSIHGAKSGDLNAVYRNAAGEVTYEMLGMRGVDGVYGFHS